MPNSIEWLVPTAIVYATTYLLHSTLLLGATWFVTRGLRIDHHRLRERLWKLAAVAALITTPLQLGLNLSNPVLTVLLEQAAPQSALAGPGERSGNASSETVARNEEAEQASRRGASSELRQGPNSDESGYDSIRPDSPAGNIVAASLRPDGRAAESSSLPLHVTSGPNEFTAAKNARPQSVLRRGFETEPGTVVRSTLRAVSTTVPAPFLNHVVLSVLAISLAVVVLAGLLGLVCDTIAFRRRLRGARLLRRGAARTSLDELLLRLSIRRSVQLLASRNHSEPAAFGVLQWRIVLPEAIAGELRSDELTALLAHELAHVVRGDTFWVWVGRLLCSCCAFQPLNFLARREWRRAAEYQCDDWAVRNGVSGLSLARCLTQVAAWKNERRPCAVSLAASGTKSNLSDRVERLVEKGRSGDSSSNRFGRGLLWLSALLATLTLPCWGPRTTLGHGTEAGDSVRWPSKAVANDSTALEGHRTLRTLRNGDESAAPSPAADAARRPTREAAGEPQKHLSSDESGRLQEISLWHDIAKETADLRNTLALLEEDVRALAETVNQSGAEQDARALLVGIRAQLDGLNKRRTLLHAIGRVATNEKTDDVTDHDGNVLMRPDK